MTRTKWILGSTGLALLFSLAGGCYLQREAFNFDNDGDGWDEVADCNDDDETINPDSRETGAACNDGVDNDCDGKVDFVDPECGDAPPPPPGTGGAGGIGAGGSSAGGSSAGGASAGGSSAGGSSAGGSSADGGGSQGGAPGTGGFGGAGGTGGAGGAGGA